MLPQSPSRLLAVFAAALTGPSILIHSHNVFPITFFGAALCVDARCMLTLTISSISGETALRAALIAAVSGWMLVDVRKPAAELVVVKPVRLIAEDPELLAKTE